MIRYSLCIPRGEKHIKEIGPKYFYGVYIFLTKQISANYSVYKQHTYSTDAGSIPDLHF